MVIIRPVEGLGKIPDRKHVIIGENHEDISMIDLMEGCLRSGRYDRLYLEALRPGHYRDYRDSGLIDYNVGVFGYHGEKYRMIIEIAMDNGVEVHGIDPAPPPHILAHAYKERERGLSEYGKVDPEEERLWSSFNHSPGRVRDWVSYMISTQGEESSLTLVGVYHVIYWKDNTDLSTTMSLPPHLIEGGVKSEDIATIVTVPVAKGDPLGLHAPEEVKGFESFPSIEVPGSLSYKIKMPPKGGSSQTIADVVFLTTINTSPSLDEELIALWNE